MDVGAWVWPWYKRVLLLGLGIVQVGCVAFATLDTVVKDGRRVESGDLRSVQVLRQGVRLSTQTNMQLQPGDEIITDAESTVWMNFADGTDVILGPDTRIKIRSIQAFFGKVFVRARALFRVDTEYVVAGTEGTEFLTIVQPPDEVSLTVLEGAVRLESKTQAWAPVLVRQAERAVMRGAESPQKQPVTARELQEIRLWVEEIAQLLPQPEPIRLPFPTGGVPGIPGGPRYPGPRGTDQRSTPPSSTPPPPPPSPPSLPPAPPVIR